MKAAIRNTDKNIENYLYENILFENSLNHNIIISKNKNLTPKNKEMDEVCIKDIFSYGKKNYSFNDEIAHEINKEKNFLVSKCMKQKNLNKKNRSKITCFNKLKKKKKKYISLI